MIFSRQLVDRKYPFVVLRSFLRNSGKNRTAISRRNKIETSYKFNMALSTCYQILKGFFRY